MLALRDVCYTAFMHSSEENLQKKLDEAASLVEVGAAYAHYKDETKTYTVKELIINESDESVTVVYKANYGEGITFGRPLASWCETVSLDGLGRVARFRRLLD
jgi:hypothetical protein